MERRIPAAALILAAACAGRLRLPGLEAAPKALNYAQYRSLERGMPAAEILRAFGAARDTLEQDGKVRGLTYPCEDATGRVVELRMAFSPGELLESWVLRDPKASAESRPPAPATSAP